MFSLVCILHSHSGTYSDSLIADATTCVRSVYQSVASASPDFIPLLAVVRADPAVGAQYLYASTVPDSNHAVEAARMLEAPFSSSLLAEAAGSTGGGNTNSNNKISNGSAVFSPIFRARSALYVQECIADGTRSAPVGAKPSESGKDPWASLAGGLLLAMAFTEKHAPQEEPDATDSNEVQPGASPRQRRLVIVFSDCEENIPPTFAVECALATAAQTAVSRNVKVFCVGQAVTVAQLPGCERLRAMSASTGGVCYSSFHFTLLEKMLGGGDDAGLGKIGRRTRMAEQYVIEPTMLSRGGEGAEENQGDEESTRSCLSWLCPACMAVVKRSRAEAVCLTEEQRQATCPYCSE